MSRVPASLSLLLILGPLAAAEPPTERGIEEVTVLAERLYRSRETMPAPTLIYEREFFQHFEPVAVGDMLKRVSSVSFSGDVGEYDAPQLRGLASQYTQVLINGERIPGASDNRSVFVDRIPADLVERIEVIRSPGPELDAQGIGGTLNIILRDGKTLDGGFWHLGSHLQLDGASDFRGNASLTYGGANDSADYFFSAHYQERLFPKVKTDSAFGPGGDLLSISHANDQRDNTDASVAANVSWDLGRDRTIELQANHIDTRIEERERIDVFDVDGNLSAVRNEREDIDQSRSTVDLRYSHALNDGGNLNLAMSASRFLQDGDLLERLNEEGSDLIVLVDKSSNQDDELIADASWSLVEISAHQLEIGITVSNRQRDSFEFTLEDDEGELVDVTRANGSYVVEERRTDAYLKDTWTVSDRVSLEYGMRFEHTELDQTGADGRAGDSQFEALPSIHLILQPGSAHQFRASLAKTLRRPAFDELVPFTDQDNPSDDQVTVGNPGLQSESALGLDLGYEHRFSDRDGIFGVNLFFRDIQDKIELVEIEEDLFTPLNIGSGTTWGVEFDLGLPLDFLNLPNVGLYANATWLDSRILDPLTGERRRFNFQPNYIGNVDLIHRLPDSGVTWGLSVQKQGSSRSVEIQEVKTVSYDANVGLFAEKTLNQNLTARLSVDNLLDAIKVEENQLFQGLTDLQNGVVTQVSREAEQTGPVLRLTLHGRF